MNNLLTNIELATSYTSKSYKRLLGDHLTSVLDYALSDHEQNKITLKFSNDLYWECINKIHESYYNQISNKLTSETEDLLFENKRTLTKSIIRSLGTFYDKNDINLVKSIDFTVNNHFDNTVFNSINIELNPWQNCDKIFTDSHLLYSFSEDKDEYKKLLRGRESELSKDATIGVLRKGAKYDFGVGYIRDSYKLRRVFLDILDEENRNHTKPIKKNDIFKLFRDRLSIPNEDLSNNNIFNWIIKPLKDNIKIGSNKGGYFIINSPEDLLHSYDSHYHNYLGYFNTLNKHASIAERMFADKLSLFQKHL